MLELAYSPVNDTGSCVLHNYLSTLNGVLVDLLARLYTNIIVGYNLHSSWSLST